MLITEREVLKMNIFIVHSGKDSSEVKRIEKRITDKAHEANILLLENGGRYWKNEAGQRIRDAQMVLFVVGENSNKSSNIDWELKQALRHNKPVYCYRLNKDYMINECLYGKDKFTSQKKLLADEVGKDVDLRRIKERNLPADIKDREALAVEEIVNRVKNFENGNYPLFTQTIDDGNRDALLEQYKIFLETSENLVSRRQSVNSFYLSANTALITIMATLITIFGNLTEKVLICILVSIVGVILSASWLGILESYGVLNSSKMKVIRIIERELPALLYDTEWVVMSDRLNSRKYVSFTDSEKKTPKIFVILYIILIIIALLIGIGMMLGR